MDDRVSDVETVEEPIYVPCVECGNMSMWYPSMDHLECTDDDCGMKRFKFGVNIRVRRAIGDRRKEEANK